MNEIITLPGIDSYLTGGANPGYDPDIDRQRMEKEQADEEDFERLSDEIAAYAKRHNGIGAVAYVFAYVANHPELWEREQGL